MNIYHRKSITSMSEPNPRPTQSADSGLKNASDKNESILQMTALVLKSVSKDQIDLS